MQVFILSEREVLATRNRSEENWAKEDVLTQNSEKGLGGLDRHGEERAGVQALVRQADVTDPDSELLRRGSYQLDSVIPQSWTEKETKFTNHLWRRLTRRSVIC